jgi:ABC-type uncharacterized transport system involved in gliding motility auxiliary subunit
MTTPPPPPKTPSISPTTIAHPTSLVVTHKNLNLAFVPLLPEKDHADPL